MDKRRTKLFLGIWVLFAVIGCGPAVQGTQSVKFEGYKAPKKLAVLPAVHSNSAVVETMNQINYQTLRNKGLAAISADEIQNFLGKDYKELLKDPTNEGLAGKISKRFGVEAFLYCKIDEWEAAVKSGDAYRSQVSLSYSFLDATTLKTLSKINGSARDFTILPNTGYVNQLASRLAAQLIGEL